jgi:hypothetical protein
MSAPQNPEQTPAPDASTGLVMPGSLTPTTPPGWFGLSSARLGLLPDAALDEVLFDALCLLDEGVRAFEAALETGAEGRAALRELRQARLMLSAAQLNHEQGAAAAAAGWRVAE